MISPRTVHNFHYLKPISFITKVIINLCLFISWPLDSTSSPHPHYQPTRFFTIFTSRSTDSTQRISKSTKSHPNYPNNNQNQQRMTLRIRIFLIFFQIYIYIYIYWVSFHFIEESYKCNENPLVKLKGKQTLRNITIGMRKLENSEYEERNKAAKSNQD